MQDYDIFVSTYDNVLLDDVLDIFSKTLEASPYPMDFDSDYWATFILNAWEHPSEFIIVVQRHRDTGLLTGVLAGCVSLGHPASKFWKCAQELFWYVDPSHRGRGSIRMKKAYEDWARNVGCSYICMSLLDNDHKEKLHRLYTSEGYKPLETNYIKAIEDVD